MTGFGEAQRKQAGLAASVEVRTVNSRYFKLTVRASEGYGALESQIEAVVRERIKRGTVSVSLRVDREELSEDFGLNPRVLEHYRAQLAPYLATGNSSSDGLDAALLAALVQLPGVVREAGLTAEDLQRDWPLVRETLEAALANMAHMRESEGRAMAADLAANCGAIAAELKEIDRRAPDVAAAYRARLAERIGRVLSEYNVSLNPGDLVREVGLFAERCDISEEIVRLRSHLEQFAAITALDESAGRKLDFLTQEMFRETNTIGSKANDVEIARRVIEIKTAIERIREMIQNVE